MTVLAPVITSPDRRDSWDPLMSATGDRVHWTTSNIGEALPGVQSPLSWTVWARSIERALRESAYAAGAFSRRERAVPAAAEDRYAAVFYGRGALRLDYLAAVGDRMPGTTGPDAVASLFGRVPDDLDFRATRRRYPIVAYRLPWTFAITPRRLRAMQRDYDTWWRAAIERVPALDERAAAALLTEAWKRHGDATVLQTIGVIAVMQPLYEAVSQLVATTGVGDVSTLAGASGGAEMAIVADIWSASRGRLAIAEVAGRHGFHGPLEGELSSGVWREDHTPLRAMVEQYATRDESADPVVRDRERRAARGVMEARMVAAVGRPRRPLVRAELALARNLLPMRGVAKRSFLQAFDGVRAAARRLGDIYVAERRLDEVDDVFYLCTDELAGILPTNAKDLVARRRERHAEYRRATIPPDWIGTPRPAVDDLPAAAAETVIDGIGVSAGIVVGTARVLLTPDFSDVQPDEVLVAPTTDPSWASIMFVSAALVVDVGGALSHAAVVAREMEIPCVVNTRVGTKALHTGDRVRVDGTRGTVQILKRKAV